MQAFFQETALISLGYRLSTLGLKWAAILQKSGDEKIENAAFEKEHVVLCLSHFFLSFGEGGEAAKITSSITVHELSSQAPVVK